MQYKLKSYLFNGAWPSGKAPVFGTGIRGFESLRPSQIERNPAIRILLNFFDLLFGLSGEVWNVIFKPPLNYVFLEHYSLSFPQNQYT
jgi:hypothetical protein